MKIKCANALPRAQAGRLAAQVKRHEGLSLYAYLDSLGVLSVGYGHNCQARPVPGVEQPGDLISRELADALFEADLELAEAEAARALPGLDILNPPRRAALINMSFNLGLGSVASGRGLMGFRRMLSALERKDYRAAAREMLDSRWAAQVGPRARELAEQMRSGRWPDEGLAEAAHA